MEGPPQRRKPGIAELTRRRFMGNVAGLGVTGLLSPSLGQATPSQSAELSGKIAGTVIDRSAPDYEQKRKSLVWQVAKPGYYPPLIIQPKSVDDVIAAVDHARRNKLKIIAKSGGHSISGSFLRDEGILLDLLGMREVTVDPEHLTATAGPGTWGPTLLHALEPHGLGFPVARGGSVSIGGYLLGGGLGFNPNTWRIACFSILGADVVTADGKLITVNEKQYPDIYWAVRGAGPGFFGVVTKYYLRVYPLPGAIMTSQYIHPLAAHEKVAAALETLVPSSDHKLELILLLTGNPDREAVAAGGPKQVCLVNAIAYGDNEADSRALLETVAATGLNDNPIAKKEYEPTSLKIMTGETGVSFPRGRMATEGVWSNSIAPVIASLNERMQQAVTPITTISIRFLGNAGLPADAAFSLSGSTNILSVLTWQDEAEDETINGWLRDTMAALQPFSLGHYINNEDVVSYPERNRHSFTPESWERLRALRNHYDPHNIFHDYHGV